MEYLRCKCTKLARLGHFPPASQAGRLAGPVFYVCVFSLVGTFVAHTSVNSEPGLSYFLKLPSQIICTISWEIVAIAFKAVYPAQLRKFSVPGMYEELPTAESLPATSTMGLRQCRGSDMSPASCRLQHKTNGTSIKAESHIRIIDVLGVSLTPSLPPPTESFLSHSLYFLSLYLCP